MYTKLKNKDKKKVILGCCVFLVISLNLVFAVSSRLKNGDLYVFNNLNMEAGKIVLTTGNDGNIMMDENKHFKRYIISCAQEIEQVQWDENNTSIDIHLDKGYVPKLILKDEKNLEAKDIYYENTNEGLILSLKKVENNNNFVFVDKNKKNNIIVLISKEDNPFSHTIVLDAGHGEKDKGANYGNIFEKDINLKIANYAAQDLQFQGFKVIQTRDTDKLLSLKEIGDITNSASADIFISIHVNENKESKYKGVTSYYYDPNNYQKEERIGLAKAIQSKLIKSDDWVDRGILRQNFAVLRYSQIPCVLLECGFLSNSEDREKLTRDSVLENFGENITNGVINYFSNE